MNNNSRTAVLPTLLLSTLALLCTACATEAPESEQVASTQERECRTLARATGSKMRRSECHTAEEWAVLDAQAAVKKTTQDEFFRRVGEGATLGPGPAYPAATSPAGL
jgi:outer membrane PBP1 activator LpoA protein